MSNERRFMEPVPYFAANTTTLDKQRELVAELEDKVRSKEFLRLPKERLAVEAELRTARHELNRMESEAMHKPARARQTAQRQQEPETFLRVVAGNATSYLCERVSAAPVAGDQRRFMEPVSPHAR